MEIFTIFALTGFVFVFVLFFFYDFFFQSGCLVWLLWDFHRLKNDIYCQAIVDILTKLHRNVT